MTDTVNIYLDPARGADAMLALLAPLTDVEDAVVRQLTIDTLTGWLTEVKADVRAWLDEIARADQVRTRSAPTYKIKGIGTASLSDPDPQIRVTDDDALATWLAAQHHEVQPHIERYVEVASADQDRVLAALDTGDHLEAGRWLTVTGRYRWPADLGEALTASGRLVALDTVQGWRLIDTASGETVPGVAVSKPDGSLTVRGDTKAKVRLRRELDGLLGPAQIGAPGDE